MFPRRWAILEFLKESAERVRDEREGCGASVCVARPAPGMQRSIIVLVASTLLLAAPAPLSSSVLPFTARACLGDAARCHPGASAGAHWIRGGGPVTPTGERSRAWVLALRGGARAAGRSEDASAMAEEGPEPPSCSRALEADDRECVAQEDHGWNDELNISSLVRGPYDPESEPNQLDDSSTTLSDASSDPLFPEAEQRQFRQMLKQHDADHGPPQADRYVGTTYPVLERVLHKSDYKTYWRPGIINKRLWAAAETGDDQEIMFVVHCLEADVNTVDLNIYNYTALFWASMNGHDKTVELLIRLGAWVNATDIYGSNALHYATDRGWPKVVEALGKAGIHSWHRNEFGRTALDWAMDFICSYNASRTPIEDKFRFVANRVVHGEGDGKMPHIAGCNWETVWVLRRVMGLPPLDKPHRTGLLEGYRQWARKHRKTSRKRREHPRTVFDMPPLLPDGTAFDDGIVLDRLPRKVSSPFYRAPGSPAVCVCVGRVCCVCLVLCVFPWRLSRSCSRLSRLLRLSWSLSVFPFVRPLEGYAWKQLGVGRVERRGKWRAEEGGRQAVERERVSLFSSASLVLARLLRRCSGILWCRKSQGSGVAGGIPSGEQASSQ